MPVENLRRVNPVLCAHHYLGSTRRGIGWADSFGVLVLSSPTARNIPTDWMELTRWCLLGKIPNAGSQQWSRVLHWLRSRSDCPTTIVSYSDPEAGHDGALYRACGWLWAPTWHRLRPPPTGNGNWGSGTQTVKDRWVYPIKVDPDRLHVLSIKDEGLVKRYPWAEYREPRFKRGRLVPGTGGGDFRRFREHYSNNH